MPTRRISSTCRSRSRRQRNRSSDSIGDIHSTWAADLRSNFDVTGSPVVATEFVGTSITSTFAPEFIGAIQAALQDPSNRHIRFFDGLRRGRVRFEMDEERWRTDFRGVATVLQPTSPIDTLATFEVHSGQSGARATS